MPRGRPGWGPLRAFQQQLQGWQGRLPSRLCLGASVVTSGQLLAPSLACGCWTHMGCGGASGWPGGGSRLSGICSGTQPGDPGLQSCKMGFQGCRIRVRVYAFVCGYMFDLGRGSVSRRCFRDILGGPVVKTPCFHCRKRGFTPWPGIPHAVQCCQKKKEVFTRVAPTRSCARPFTCDILSHVHIKARGQIPLRR